MNESISQSCTRTEGLPTEKENLSNNSYPSSSTTLRENIKIIVLELEGLRIGSQELVASH